MAIITRSSRRRKPRVDIVPMIDVMFFLVLFFVMFTTFRTVEEGIPVNLPQSSSGESVTVQELVVTVTRDGSYFIGNEQVSPLGLRSAVASMVSERENVVVFIRGDQDAAWRWMVAAHDAAKEGGAQQVIFLVVQSQEERLI